MRKIERKIRSTSSIPNIDKRFIRALGFRGLIKSAYLSRRYTDSRLGLLVGKNTSVSISTSATVNVGSRFTVGVQFPRSVHPACGGSRLDIGPDASLQGPDEKTAAIGAGSVVNIQGDFQMGNSYISGDSRITCNNYIEIGDECAISWNTEFLDATAGHKLSIGGEERSIEGEITIGDNVWIGHGSTVHHDVTIGDGAVVASNSLVNKDVPPETLVAGSPAEPIKNDVDWW
ncbi:acyltransferase [Haloarcula laminariae]|uniref:acyltransferase n=1 Tax=Haloarcula laminariae TaxID=2961577 RepID=UPI0024072962|nr:acyltransferase [Halomicroarcula sp. FL173]